jgi:hypothetical protein
MEEASAEQKQNGIDYVLSSSDNSGKYGVDEIIDMKEREPLNDRNCLHPSFHLDGDEMGNNVAVKCDICPVGWFITKAEARSLGLS